jgi:hypothetical protein
MIAKAKEEKVFMYYSTTDIRDGTAMVHAFQKKYPFVLSTVEGLRERSK